MGGMIPCRENFYNYPALIAPMPWIDSIRPSIPVVHINSNQDSLSFVLKKAAEQIR